MSLQLRPWLIAEIARDAEIDFKIKGDKAAIKCPFHDDRTSSAIITVNNVFYCSACTPNGGWPAKRFCEGVGQRWEHYTRGADRGPSVPRPPPKKKEPTFTASMARSAWLTCFKCANDISRTDENRQAFDYLIQRRILEAVEVGVLGIVGKRDSLPREMSRWWINGYRIVAPLYDHAGVVTGIQSRTIFDRSPKTLFPWGCVAAGSFFADHRAAEILRTGESASTAVIVAEGLTDFAALSIVSPIPVVSGPGTGFAKCVAGPWVRERHVLLALDCDPAGANAVAGAGEAFHKHGASRVQRIGWPQGCKDACDFLDKCGSTAVTDFIHTQLAKRAL